MIEDTFQIFTVLSVEPTNRCKSFAGLFFFIFFAKGVAHVRLFFSIDSLSEKQTERIAGLMNKTVVV